MTRVGGDHSITIADVVEGDCAVWGAGREALAAVDRLISLGRTDVPVVVDGRPGDPSGIEEMEHNGSVVRLFRGDCARSILAEAEFVIVSPGIPDSNANFEVLRNWSTTFDLWMAEFGDRAVAVTGSKGKSTTTALLGQLLKASGVQVAIGGNIGRALFGLDAASELFVVEVGSPQASRMRSSPEFGVITALFPEHLDWHGSVADYYAAKANLFNHGSRLVVTTAEVASELPTLVAPTLTIPNSHLQIAPDGLISIGGFEVPKSWTANLPGQHNVSNVALAIAAAESMGLLAYDAIESALRSYVPLPHRLMLVATSDGIDWVDDSLATAPQPVIAALSLYADRRVVLLLGGRDRGVDIDPLCSTIAKRASETKVVVFDESRIRFGCAIRAQAPDVPLLECDDLHEALAAAQSIATSGDVVLFSPASPSSGNDTYVSRSATFAEFATAVKVRKESS